MTRFLAIASALAMFVLLAAPLPPARAQAPEGEVAAEGGGGDSGNPLYGYVGTGFLLTLPIFILCKSARR